MIRHNDELIKPVPSSIEEPDCILYDLPVGRVCKKAISITSIKPLLNPCREAGESMP